MGQTYVVAIREEITISRINACSARISVKLVQMWLE